MSDDTEPEYTTTMVVAFCSQGGCDWQYISDDTFPQSLRADVLNDHLWVVHGVQVEP